MPSAACTPTPASPKRPWRPPKHSLDGDVYAHVEIAKYYEHRAGDFTIAIQYTQRAIQLVEKTLTPELERLHWQPLLVHRLARLERKAAQTH